MVVDLLLLGMKEILELCLLVSGRDSNTLATDEMTSLILLFYEHKITNFINPSLIVCVATTWLVGVIKNEKR